MKLEIIGTNETREAVPFGAKEVAQGDSRSRLVVRSSVTGKLYLVDVPSGLFEEYVTVEAGGKVAV